ncbi:MAG: (d)CMP kinase [Phycisphaerales bacterium]
MTGPVTITIDGPAGTGKSTIARLLAQRLGLEFLDTGAMYRAAALLALENGVDLTDGPAIARLIDDSHMRFDWTADPPDLCVEFPECRSLMTRIRDADVSAAVSAVSAAPEVREAMVARQRKIRNAHPRLVSEGRDQGSVVFPDANVKFYLDASPRIRAQRRVDQLRELGRPVDLEVIERDIIRRDAADRTRAVGPLVIPDEAIVVDTSSLSIDEVIDTLASTVHERLDSRDGDDEA